MLAGILGVWLGTIVGIPLVENIGEASYERQKVDTEAANDFMQLIYEEENTATSGAGSKSLVEELFINKSSNIRVVPHEKAVINTSSIIMYFMFIIILLTLTLFIQVIYLLRFNPAKIMTRR